MRRELTFWGSWGLFLLTVAVLAATGLPVLVAVAMGVLVAFAYVMSMWRPFFR